MQNLHITTKQVISWLRSSLCSLF